MNALTRQKCFEVSQRRNAQCALSDLSDTDKANFALALLMEIKDPDAVAAMRYAASRVAELTNIMMREAFERECG